MYIHSDQGPPMTSLFMPPKKYAPTPELFPVVPSGVSPAERVKLLARVASFYQRTFMDSQEGLRYLTKVCGIRDVSLFKTFYRQASSMHNMDIGGVINSLGAFEITAARWSEPTPALKSETSE